jgi:spore germination protein KB
MEKTISVRQLSLIAFISTFAMKLIVLPALIYQKVQSDAIFVILGYILFNIISFFFIYYLLRKNQDISISTFLSKHFGKFIGKLILFLIAGFFFFKMLLLTSGGYNYCRQVIYREASLFFYIFILYATCSSLYLFRAKSFARTIEFFYPIIMIIFIIFIAVAGFTGELYDLRPYFTTGAGNIFDSMLSLSITSGDYIFMLLLMGRVKFHDKKSDMKTLIGHILFASLILMVFYYIYFSIFKYTAMVHPHAISEIVQFIPLPTILGNFDLFAVTLMMFMFLLQGSLFFFCINDSLYEVIKIKKIAKSKIERWILLFTLILLLVSIYFIFVTFENIKVFSIDYVKYLNYFIFNIPLILFLIEIIKESVTKLKIRRKKLNEKNI